MKQHYNSSRRKNNAKLIISIVLILLIFAGGANVFSVYYSSQLDDSKIVSPSAKLKIIDAEGSELLYRSSLNEYVKYDQISPNIINAFVALEDKRFFKHKGLDYYRIGGAIVHNIKAKRLKEGASTISQQLAKNTQLSNEKTFERKIREMRITRQIEKKYSKESILEMYLNAIYFGNGIYGIGKACKTIFAKPAREITLPEAAMLAGIVRSPGRNSPLNNIENAEKRKNLALSVMMENQFISKTEYEQAKNYVYSKPVLPEEQRYDRKYAYCAISEAAKILGITEKELIENNYTIQTYMDNGLQEATDRAIASQILKRADASGEIPTCILVVDNFTLGVTAFSANFDYNIFLLTRQPGSCIKPFISYIPALEKGVITPASPVVDEPRSYNGYAPKNYRDSYYGKTDIETAVAKSLNSVPVELASGLGLDYCKEKASAMGLSFSGGDNNLSLALGGMEYGVTPLQLSEAYAAIARMGNKGNAAFVQKIYGPNNELVYTNDSISRQVISPSSAYLMTEMLKQTTERGTARKLSALGYPIAAKTGTVGYEKSELNSDAWCLSYTGEHTVCVWSGNLTQKKEERLPKDYTGGSMPALISRFVYENLYKQSKPKDFEPPEDVVKLDIDLKAREEQQQLYLACPFTPPASVKSYYFSIYNAPSEYSNIYDVILPPDFAVGFIEGAPRITFTASANQSYQIVKEYLDSKTIVDEIAGFEGLYEFYDEDNTDTGLIRYRLIVQNEYGGSAESAAQSVLISGYEHRFPFERFRWRLQ
jgi:penicillin-binding protein 2A